MVTMLASIDELDFGAYLRMGDGLVWGQACAEPRTLVEHLMADIPPLSLRAFVGIPLAGSIDAAHARRIRLTSYTGSGSNADLHSDGLLDIVPRHYSAFPDLLAHGVIGADVVLVQVSPPDANGHFSLGIAAEYLVDALHEARVVIAEVGPDVPWTYGGPTLTADDFTVLVSSTHPPMTFSSSPASEAQSVIAELVASLIEDGSTLQLGVGSLSEVVLAHLHDRRHLGIHSGMLQDGIMDLMQRGVITGDRKTVDRGRTVGGMLLGGRALFDYAHRNPRIHLRETSYTHNPQVLAAQRQLVALNSAVEVDLTGQVNSEVARSRYIGSVGGAADFLRGAARSKGGLPIIMLPSHTGTTSRIVERLSGPVSIPRSDVGIVVTEHGIADLRGLDLRRRRERLIAIAAPQFRNQLDQSPQSALATPAGK